MAGGGWVRFIAITELVGRNKSVAAVVVTSTHWLCTVGGWDRVRGLDRPYAYFCVLRSGARFAVGGCPF